MIERFTDSTLARTYLSLRKETLCLKFFKKQLENEDGDLLID